MFSHSSHRLVDPLYEHRQEEDGGDGRGEVAGHRLDVIKQLTALSCLDDGDPADADGNDAQDPDSGGGGGGVRAAQALIAGLDVPQHARPHLPTIMSSRSVACGLTRVQMSMVNRVLLLLKMEAREDMSAASITASIRPRSPAQRGQEGRRERGRST